MLVAAYHRTSTRKQDLEGQRRATREWASKHGHDLTVFEDDHTSGRRTDRAGIESVIAAAERGEFSLLAVTELSRIGRSVGFIYSTVERLAKHGVSLVLVNSSTVLSLNTLEARALLGALALACDVEWMLLSERNTRARETMKQRGIRGGRKKHDVSEAAILALREKGWSSRRIARELGTSHPTVVRRLKALGREVLADMTTTEAQRDP